MKRVAFPLSLLLAVVAGFLCVAAGGNVWLSLAAAIAGLFGGILVAVS